MAGGYDVSVTLKLNDQASKNLQKIEDNIRRVLKAAQEYDDLLDKIYGRTWNGGNVVPPIVPGTGKTPGGSTALVPTGSTAVSNSVANAATEYSRLNRSLSDLSATTKGMYQAQQNLNKEFKHMPDMSMDTSVLEGNLNDVFNSMSNILARQKEFTNTAHKMGEGLIPPSVTTSLDATKNAIDTAAISYKRLQIAMQNGEGTLDDVKATYTGLENAMKHINASQQQINSAMKNTKLPAEQIELLRKAYDELNAEMQSAVDVQNKLIKATAKTMFDPVPVERYDKELGGVNQSMQLLITAHNDLQKETKETTAATDSLNKELDETKTSANESSSVLGGLKNTVKGLVGAYAGIETLKTALNWSDELTMTEGKLANLTDDVEGFMDKVYQMSQDTRTSYMDNAKQMAKMWMLTDGTDGIFDTEEKLIQFNELLNKSFRLGGSGTREINASMYQLTQALSSGRLQGDELRSLGENASYFINTLTNSIEDMYNAGKSQDEWIELTYNDLKKLGAEGVLTSELITNAILNSADKIRAEYENMEMTWDQLFEMTKNQVQKVTEPLLQTLRELANNEFIQKFVQAFVKMYAVLVAILNPLIQGLMWIGEIVADNWDIIEPVIWGIVGALAAYYGITFLVKTATWLYTKAMLIQKGVLKAVETATILYRGVQAGMLILLGMLTGAETAHASALWASIGPTLGLSAATWSLVGPILIVIAIIGALIAAVYLVVYVYNKWTGSTVSATGIIVGAFYWMYAYVYNVIARMWNELVTFAEFIANLFNDPIYTLKKAFGDLAISVINIWMGINNAIINIVNSIKGTINGFLSTINDMINSVVDVYNETLGQHFGKWGKVNLELTTDKWEESNTMLEGWKSNIESWVGEPNKTPISYDKYRMEEKDLSEYYDKGYTKGEKFAEDLKNMFSMDEFDEDKYKDETDPEKYLNGIPGMDEYLNSLPNYKTPNVGTSSSLPDDVTNAINGIKGNTDDIADMGEEDLKYLRDIAEQKVINRFTTAEIKVTNNMNNNISSDRDIDGMADYFAQVIEKACETTAERTNAMG